jgi:hypothetical protein
MQVEDRLARIGVAVEHRSISAGGVPVVFGDRCRASHHLANERVIASREVVQARDMPSRNDKHVRRCLRRDVFERDDVVVLIDDGCGNLSLTLPPQNGDTGNTLEIPPDALNRPARLTGSFTQLRFLPDAEFNNEQPTIRKTVGTFGKQSANDVETVVAGKQR